MASNSEFWESYKDPRWQKKRLEVMDAAGFKCQECKTSEVTLHVHHRHYRRGAKPWEYELRDLRCLCENCHDAVSVRDALLKQLIGQLTAINAEQAFGYLSGLVLQQHALNGSTDSQITLSDDKDTAYVQAVGVVQAYGGDAWNIVVELNEQNQIDHETICTLWREYDEASGKGR